MTNKAKVVLINPPLPEGVSSHPFFAPLGLAYMAAVLDQKGYEVRIYDCPVSGINQEKLKSELSSYQPNIIGFGSFTSTIRFSPTIGTWGKRSLSRRKSFDGWSPRKLCRQRNPGPRASG